MIGDCSWNMYKKDLKQCYQSGSQAVPELACWERATPGEMDQYGPWISAVRAGIRPFFGKELRATVGTALGVTTKRRCMYITKAGYIGLCPPETEPGDEVWILYGGKTPLILRPCSELTDLGGPKCKLTGDCYLDGFMDGEAVESGQHKAQRVVLV